MKGTVWVEMEDRRWVLVKCDKVDRGDGVYQYCLMEPIPECTRTYSVILSSFKPDLLGPEVKVTVSYDPLLKAEDFTVEAMPKAGKLIEWSEEVEKKIAENPIVMDPQEGGNAATLPLEDWIGDLPKKKSWRDRPPQL